MERILLFWFLLCSTIFLGTTAITGNASKVIYVKEGSSGTGKSWGSAFGDLQQALKKAKKGDQIWVTKGMYLPTEDSNREISFRLLEGVSMYGGFAGVESSLEERDIATNLTILSGAIGTATKEDNSFTVVYAEKISPLTVIDGFIIAHGNSNGTDKGVNQNTCGAGWFNSSASPSIRNCIFKENTARAGGGMYNHAGNQGVSSPRIAYSSFINNRADIDGGAIFNNGDRGRCMMSINASKFINNVATYGGGIMNRAVNGITKINIARCLFQGNKSLVKGDEIYNHRDNSGLCTTMEKDNFVEKNTLATVGADVTDIVLNPPPSIKASGAKQLPNSRNIVTDNSWCYNNDQQSCERYGRLYTFHAAKQICGSSIPSFKDWETIIGGYYDDENKIAVGNPETYYQQFFTGLNTEAYNQHKILGGRLDSGQFIDQGIVGYFWTSTPRKDKENYIIYFDSRDGMVHKGWAKVESGLSCLCLK